jgi:hypothetical protein
LWTKLCLAFGVLLLLAGGGSLVGVQVLVSSATKAIPQNNLIRGASDATTMELLAAAKNDTMATFVISHPELLVIRLRICSEP